MWAQGNQWGNQIPLDAAAYQNMNHELVDWASLAQQWIRMKEVHETVVLNVPEMAQSHYQSNINLLRSSPAVELQPSDSNVTSGEAPMDVEKEDEITSSASDWSWQSQSLNQQTHNWPLQHGPYVPRHSFPQVTHPGAANLPTALGPSQTFLSTISPSMNFTPRVPLLPLPPSARPNSSDEDSLGASSFNSMPSIDASKRKNLPAWIREGLEKMEKEKQKKEEREKFLLERELRRKKELESGGQGDLAVTRSRFDDSEEEEDDTADDTKSPLKESTPTAVSNAPTLEDIMVRIRQLMTEILLEVTTEEIRSAAVEASQRAKVKNRQVQSPLSSKSLTRKLGLDQYGSDSEGDDSDQERVKANRTSGFEDGTAETLRGKNYEKQQRMEEIRASDRFSQVEKDLNHPEKPSHSVELEKNKSSGESFSKVLQDGTKVDKDIKSKFPHGHAETSSPSEKEDSAAKSEKISDFKRDISVVRENSMTSKSQDRSNAGSSRSRQRSRTPERRKRSRSRDCQYSRDDYSRRSRDYPKSRRRSRSRERKRSNSRRRSRDRRRSVSRRRSRSNDRKSMSSKGKERASSKDRRK